LKNLSFDQPGRSLIKNKPQVLLKNLHLKLVFKNLDEALIPQTVLIEFVLL